jgi:hypothetical protein
MWKITLCCNIFILSLLWLLAQVAIIPANSFLVQYTETMMALPILTDFTIRVRSLTGAIPIIWAIFTLLLGWQMRKQTTQRRNECLLTHTSVTVCIGLVLVLFFSLAGLLPILRIGSDVF